MSARPRTRRRTAKRAPPVRPPRTMRLGTISSGKCEAIFQGVLTVLLDAGLQVEDTEARTLLVAAGCRDRNGRISYPPDVVRRALQTVPKAIRFYTQAGELAFATDDTIARFGTTVNCVQVLDPRTGEYRPCLLSDIADHGRMQEALPYIDFAGALGYPTDVDAKSEALTSARTMLGNTQKPIFFTGHDAHGVRDIWDHMATRVGGMGNLAAKPIGLDLIGPLSPL